VRSGSCYPYCLPRAGGGTADAHGSGPCVRKDVRVQIPPRPRDSSRCSQALRASFPEIRGVLARGGDPPEPPGGPPSALVLAVGLVPVCCGFRRWAGYRFVLVLAGGLVPVCCGFRRCHWVCPLNSRFLEAAGLAREHAGRTPYRGRARGVAGCSPWVAPSVQAGWVADAGNQEEFRAVL
jgi:hypothetical protein